MPVEKSVTNRSILPWLIVTLLAQTAWGAYPVFARYLQTVSGLPSMSIIAMGSFMALIVTGFFLIREIQPADLRSWRLLAFALVVVGRGTSNFLASRFTLATYVLLITLLTPFLVSLLSQAVWHEEIPKYTGRALLLSLLGVIMIIGPDLSAAQDTHAISRSDWLGIGLASISSFLLALYMIAVKRSKTHGIRAELLLFVQLASLLAAGLVLSLLSGESWQSWLAIGTVDWLVFAVMAMGVLVGANLGQISAIRHLGAPLVSSTMPWRLVSVLVVSALLLDERLASAWQVSGVILVLATITWYLWQQRQ